MDAVVNARRLMHLVDATVVPRVSCIAGDEKHRCDGGKTQEATAKPVPGFETHACHLRTPSLNAHELP